jgi:small-conductance mechanosensitive channel
MKPIQWVISIGLLLLVLAAASGVFLTRASAPAPIPSSSAGNSKPKAKSQLIEDPYVDEHPLTIARSLAPLATTPEEQQFQRQAEKFGDLEVDLAFADTLSDARQNPPPITPANKELFSRRAATQAAVQADTSRVATLTKQLAAAPDAQKDKLQDQLDVAKAQLELDQDELDDAKEDVLRAGADPEATIQQLFEAHEATHTESQAVSISPNSPDLDYSANDLVSQFRAWRALRDKQLQLAQAQAETSTKTQYLSGQHQELDQRVDAEGENRSSTKRAAAGFSEGPSAADRETSQQKAQAALAALKHFSQDQKHLADLDKRVHDEVQLAAVYSQWSDFVAFRQRTALNGMLRSTFRILIILLAAYLASLFIQKAFKDHGDDRSRHTVRLIFNFAIQTVAVLLILLVVFGAPNQAPTVLGLAGAGLTVALKDFIVAFIGWFVLMGKNGIRVGDWVEINGVAGEVVEIGLLRTVLLETGNWAETGHPTGRKVAFVNSFAIEGHFFNFSTTGQWLWDEVTLTLPPRSDPYSLVADVQKLVQEQTEASVRSAEEEWAKSAGRYKVRSVTAAPAVNLRPTPSGTEIHVRYITRAHERYTMRTQLYQKMVDLFRNSGVAAAGK